MIKSIKIEVDGKEIEMTLEQVKEFNTDLRGLFTEGEVTVHHTEPALLARDF